MIENKHLAIGMRVRLQWDTLADGQKLARFVPMEAASGNPAPDVPSFIKRVRSPFDVLPNFEPPGWSISGGIGSGQVG